MKTRYSNGFMYIDIGQIVSRHAVAYMKLPGAGVGAHHDANTFDAGYCIDAPEWMPAGSLLQFGLMSVSESRTLRGF